MTSYAAAAEQVAPRRERRLLLRRLLFLALVLPSWALLASQGFAMAEANGITVLEGAIFVLFTILMLPLVLSFWMATLGFVVELRGRDPLGVEALDDALDAPLTARTAIVVPAYNEDPMRLFAGLSATLQSLQRTGHADAFDLFVLSDTTDLEHWLTEERAFVRFRARAPDPERVHYRKRVRNVERKAGNIAEFCAEWGDRYRYMVVFDADSVMSGRCLVQLVRAMERHPEAGIVQAPPVPVNRKTLFGRVQQFAARAYGPTFTSGLAFLQGGEGNYWGHNAILRIAPFVAHCKLPKLPGKEPLGGSILSHDFVEAALMRRAGYRVYLAPHLAGSFEEPPPTLIDFAVRDRRWCQGNLQHAKLLRTPGLHPVSRMHLFLGIMAYLGSPLWILLLLLSTAEALRTDLAGHEYFSPDAPLFPVWRVSIVFEATVLFLVVMAMLLLPKALAVCARLRDPAERQCFGGAAALLWSSGCEVVFSTLLAPVLALLQSRFVIGILAGRKVGWSAQQRGDRGTTVLEALRRHGGTTLLGIAWAVLLQRWVPELFWWMLPVLLGVMLAVPLSIVSSRIAAGAWLRRHGLLLTPEEVEPPFVLRRLRSELEQAGEADDRRDSRPALQRVLEDPTLREQHLSLLPPAPPRDPLEEHHLQGLVLKARLRGAAALGIEEQRLLLFAPDALTELAAAPR